MSTRLLPRFLARNYDFTEYTEALNWIGGSFCRPSSSAQHIDVINPRYDAPMGTLVPSNALDVAQAVEAAKQAQVEWSMRPIRERAQVLFKLRELMLRDVDELTWLLSHENGKTFAQAKGSVAKGIECLEYGMSLEHIAQGGQLDVSRGVNCSVTHEPLGVVAGIVPFNFPTMVPMWMLPQALVAGNAFVLKPSEKVPFSMMRIAELLHEAGLPAGVLNLVQGGKEAALAIVDHPEIKAVGFVGSTKIAKLVYMRGTALGKNMLCLGGAKNHLVVVPDADVALTADNVLASFAGCAGQRCMAAANLIAVGDVDHIICEIVSRAKKVVLGESMGAIISKASRDRIVECIGDAQEKGATLLVDGRHATVLGQPGYWLGPTVIDHAGLDMRCTSEEIFGPVLSIIRVDTLDEAIKIENENSYGNAASIYTSSGAVAEYASKRFESGMIGVNIGVPVPREPFSFGGWNDSKFGSGDITGWDGFRFWTRPRKVTTKWALQSDQSWMS